MLLNAGRQRRRKNKRRICAYFKDKEFAETIDVSLMSISDLTSMKIKQQQRFFQLYGCVNLTLRLT